VTRVDVGTDKLHSVVGAYRFDQAFFQPNAEVRIRVEGREPALDWGNNLKSALIPVSPTEFIDRQFWARIVVDEDGTGFTYSSSGSRFRVKRVSSE
jgi:hypothetical protein